MPAKNVEKFFEKVAENKALQGKLNALYKQAANAAEKGKQQTAAKVAKIASAAGFKFTGKDLILSRGAKGRMASGAQLREVAGQAECGNRPRTQATLTRLRCLRRILRYLGSWH
jgi:phage-related tail protein